MSLTVPLLQRHPLAAIQQRQWLRAIGGQVEEPGEVMVEGRLVLLDQQDIVAARCAQIWRWQKSASLVMARPRQSSRARSAEATVGSAPTLSAVLRISYCASTIPAPWL